MVEGLSFLHDRGIVHRDLKPGNVFLENGVVKIGDVGLSKFISESHRSAQTQSVGTVYYMAPEVAHGRYGREVDVYSLGIVAVRAAHRPRPLRRRVGGRNPDETSFRKTRPVADPPAVASGAGLGAGKRPAAPHANGAAASGRLQQGGRRLRSAAGDSGGILPERDDGRFVHGRARA